MDISVIVCTFNRSDSLGETLFSLNDQKNLNYSYEVIVIDNNSTDATKTVTDNHRKGGLQNLTYIFEPRPGKSFALNTGIRNSKADIVAFVDDDVITRHGWIDRILDYFNSDKTISGLAGRVLPKIEGKLPKWMNMEGEFLLKGPLNYYDHGDKAFLLEPGRMPFLGANMALRREVFNRNGYFNESMKQLDGKYIVGEDSEYFHYITRRGEKIMYAPDVVVEHVFDATRLNKKYLKKWYFFIGTSTVILNGRDRSRVFFRIPLWLLKDTLLSFLRSLKVCWKQGSAETFFLITRFYFNVGKIRGYLLYDKYAIERLEALRKC